MATAPDRTPTRARARLLALALGLGTAALLAEAVARVAQGYRLGGLELVHVLRTDANTDPGAAGRLLDFHASVTAPVVAASMQGRTDLDAAWIRTSPAPVPHPPTPDMLAQRFARHREWLFLYEINAAFLKSLWVPGQGVPLLAGIELPDSFSVFDAPGGQPLPKYRYPASVTLPTGMVTNRFGFRGRELAPQREPGVVRIGFVGASTTVEAPRLPHSAPELVEHWLNLWAAARGHAVRFETLNAAREAIASPDIRAIVEQELLPLDVDRIVYYEGANQFTPAVLDAHVEVQGTYELAAPPPGLVGTFDEAAPAASRTWTDVLCTHSAVATALRSLGRGREVLVEPAKPEQSIQLPPGVGPASFDLAQAGSVLQLGAILGDLDAIHAAAAPRDARVVVVTFCWLARLGLQLDGLYGRNAFIQLNRAYWPFEYATIRTLADVQNRGLEAWARARGVDVIDLASQLPMDDRLYIDAIHHSETGVRLKAWLLFCALTKQLEADLAAGALPRPVAQAEPPVRAAPRTVTRADLDAGR